MSDTDVKSSRQRLLVVASDKMQQERGYTKAVAKEAELALLQLSVENAALQAENEALRAQAVTVKPLEWEHQDGNYPMWTVNEPVWGGRFEAKIDKSEPLMCGRFPLFINGRWDGKKHQNLKSAKAAAQADYERRILAAISALAEKEDG